MFDQLLTYIWKKHWWAHGAISAISLTTVVEEVTDLSRFEFLSILTLLLLNWNQIVSIPIDFLTYNLCIPKLDIIQKNILIFFIATMPLIVSDWGIRYWILRSFVSIVLSLVLTFIVYFVSMLFVEMADRVETLGGFLLFMVAMYVLYKLEAFDDIVHFVSFYLNKSWRTFLMNAPYKYSFAFSISFFGLIVVLQALNSPEFSSNLINWLCDNLSEKNELCFASVEAEL